MMPVTELRLRQLRQPPLLEGLQTLDDGWLSGQVDVDTGPP
jgi:hypothetical protein